MTTTVSGCVGCGFPRRGHACPNFEIDITECDDCGDECEEVYEVDGDELCLACLKARFRRK